MGDDPRAVTAALRPALGHAPRDRLDGVARSALSATSRIVGPAELTLIDAFVTRPFAGNQAAVAVLERWPAGATMQQVTVELGWSETAFTVPRPDGDCDLRWFTPVAEVDLCGHATLATAHVLGGSTRFHTRSGPLECRPSGAPEGWNGDWTAMAFPANPPDEASPPDALDLAGMQWFGYGRFDAVAVLDRATASSIAPSSSDRRWYSANDAPSTSSARVPASSPCSRPPMPPAAAKSPSPRPVTRPR